MIENHKHFFGERSVIFKSKAPARLDVMGGVADYSGSLVLQMPLNLCTTVFVAKREDSIVRIQSGDLFCQTDLKYLIQDKGNIIERQSWTQLDLPDWSLYVLGCYFVLLDKKVIDFCGLDIWIETEVPFGKGISSSAALEIATMGALYKTFNLKIEKEPLAVFAQIAENKVAGAACGIMDQMAVHLGQKDCLLPILCQPHLLGKPIPIPKGIHLCGLDTGVKHSVSGNAYSRVRTAAFMGLSIILQSLGVDQETIIRKKTNPEITLPFDSYLANVPLKTFEEKFSKLLPEKMQGNDFLKQFRETTDPLSTIEADVIYKVNACTKHPIYENGRIHRFQKLLGEADLDLNLLGQLMMESHQGYVDCDLSCTEADYIIKLVKEKAGDQVFGARITGGGSGGAVCILAKNRQVVEDIQKAYSQHYKHKTTLFFGSGNGMYWT